MKLPRDLSAADLEKALRRAFGYQFVRQLGSHPDSPPGPAANIT